ncbi:hypothetical protein BgAZ_107160 [Babesia gibsoni]|uniref:CERLI1-like PH domain-containing protein n=1 Tax=Babesia gibsoni TaxID=33632 RepID=A0AAD8PG38_BABGI|nr:hypothetical protein BgAZ_107160 [Babesia gibsoni]
MFLLDPVLPGYCGIGCCGLVAANYVAKNIHKIPHPSECGCIGSIYRISGIHDHDPFDVIIEIHEALNYLDRGKYYFEIESGRKTYRTQTINVRDGKLEIHEKINVHVRQCDDKIYIKLYNKHLISSKVAAQLVLSVKNDLLVEKPAHRRWFTMTQQDRSSTRVKVSIYKLSDGIAEREISSLALHAIIEAQGEGEAIEEELLDELDTMDDYKKLRFFSKVISGPLKKMNTFGKKWTSVYFKPLEISPGNWEWCMWNSLEDFNAGLEAIEAYSFLSMSVVIADPTNRNCFYIKYHKEGNEFGILLKKVDRDRDVWSDSLYEFIERSRDIYFKNPQNQLLKKSQGGVKRCKALDTPPATETPAASKKQLEEALAKSKRLSNPSLRPQEDQEALLNKNLDRMAQQMYTSE